MLISQVVLIKVRGNIHIFKNQGNLKMQMTRFVRTRQEETVVVKVRRNMTIVVIII